MRRHIAKMLLRLTDWETEPLVVIGAILDVVSHDGFRVRILLLPSWPTTMATVRPKRKVSD